MGKRRRQGSAFVCCCVLWLIPYEVEGQERDRSELAGVGGSSASAASRHNRLHEYVSGLFSPISIVSSAASAGMGQWRVSPKEWGQGGAGYGARFASSFGTHIVRQSIVSGTAALLNEDTRYLPSGESHFGPRLKYALASTFLARGEDGYRQVSLSKIGGFVGAAFISRAWQPPSTAHTQNAFANIGVSVGITAGMNVAREFLPRIFRKGQISIGKTADQ